MHIRIFTLPFDEITEGFPDEIVQTFCHNKAIHDIKAEFFLTNGKPYWSVVVKYDILVKDENKIRELDDEQKLLFQRLREWRKEQAKKEGFPAYLVCRNADIIYMIRHKCTTLECLKNIKGFGRSRINKYGRAITDIIKAFYEKPPPVQADEKNS